MSGSVIYPVWQIVYYLVGGALTDLDVTTGAVVAALFIGGIALGLFVAFRRRKTDDDDD